MLTADSFLAIFIGVTKPPVLSLRRGEFADLLPLGPADPLHYHLGHSLSAPDDNRLFAQINGNQLNLSPVIRIDGPGAIDQGKSRSQGETASGPNLRFKARWQRYSDAGRYEDALHRLKDQIFFQIR